MRLVGAAFVAGMLGVLIGSLAAQAPRDDQLGVVRDDIIFEGNAEVILDEDHPAERVLEGNARVSESWVVMTDTGIMIPREQVRMVTGREGVDQNEPAEDFGNTPGETTPRRKPFRED